MNDLKIDNLFWMAIGLIFFVTLFGGLVRRLKRDRCLLLFHTHHVTFLADGKNAVAGDMNATSRGIELGFDQFDTVTTGRVRTGMLVYDQELSGCVVLCRTEHGLTDAEKTRRRRQLLRLVNPHLLQRSGRQLINFINIVRDAIIQSVGLFLGKIGGRPGGLQTLAREQSSRLTEFSGNVLGLFNNAYEPLLERHIGKPVVLTVRTREKPEIMEVDFYGYLGDYNERFIILLNPDQLLTKIFEGEIVATIEVPGGKVERTEDKATFVCKGAEAWILEEVRVDNRAVARGVSLLKGGFHTIECRGEETLFARISSASAVDLLCPRTCAQVRYVASVSRRFRHVGDLTAQKMSGSERISG